MEDRHVVVERTISGRRVILCGVYDGHGGIAVVEVAASELHRVFFEALEAGVQSVAALRTAYAAVASGTSKYDDTGSTACTAVLADSELTVAYLGDSRLALIRPGSVDLFTPAHRVEHPEERARIIARGGTIVGQYLFRGTAGVMLTRAFGDGWYRPVGLIDRPDLLRVDLDATAPHLVVLATDGLWDVVGPETIAKLLLDWIRMECFADVDHARALVDLALANDALDNVTVVTIASMPADGPAPA